MSLLGRSAADRTADLETLNQQLHFRNRQQAAVVALSQAAIGAADLTALMDQSVALATSTLRVEVAEVVELLSDGERAEVRAEAGRSERLVGQAAAVAGTPLDAMLRSDTPFLRTDRSLGAIIRGLERPWGALFVHAEAERGFTPDDAEFLQSLAQVLSLSLAERKREDHELAESQRRFARIFQISPVALGMSTITDGRLLDVNEAWLRLFGYEREEVIGRTSAELPLAVEPGARPAAAREAQQSGMVRNREMKVRTKSGAILDLIVSAVPFNAGTHDETWISALVDITDRNRAEAERNELLARERAARAEAEDALEKLQAVYTITESVVPHGALGELLGELLRRLRRTLQVDYATVLLLDEERRGLYLRAGEGPVPGPLPPVHVPLGKGVSGRIAAEGRPLIVNNYSAVDVSGIEGPWVGRIREVTSSVMGAPFRIGEKVAGVVMASCEQPRQFTQEELKLLVLAADRVAPAIERGRLIEKIRSGRERQKALSRRLLTAQEEERRRLAVELHDELGQVLTAVKINLESLERAPDVPPTRTTRTALAGMIRSVDDALQRVRDIALDLRPSVLDDLGLPAAVRWYADRLARDTGVEAHLSIDALPDVEPGLGTACFRVAQEALTNVGRHARARHVWIDLHFLAGAVELTVRDDGIGFDVGAARERAIAGASVGLLGMQERVSLLGGEYEIVNVPAGGTEVRARFPVAERPQTP